MGILSTVEAKEIHANIPFPEFPSFIIGFKYCGVTELEGLQKSCSRKIYNPKNRQTEESIDEKLFRDKLASDIITGWEGLTIKIARELMPLEQSKLDAAGLTNESIVEGDVDDRLMLLTKSIKFKTWALETISDLTVFEQYKKVEELENLK